MEQNDIARYKEALEEEKKEIEARLDKRAIKNKKVVGDWIPFFKRPRSGTQEDDNIRRTTDILNNAAIANDLEGRLGDVNRALKKIESGGFGICEVTGQDIEKKRLDANPAARTCIEHKDDDLSAIN